MGWYQYAMNVNSGYFDEVRRVYGLTEAIFFLWFVSNTGQRMVWRLGMISIVIIVPLWFILEWVIPLNWLKIEHTIELAYFQALYRILVSFLAGYTLLQLNEKQEEHFLVSAYWLVGGILLYNFATFFIMILQRVDLAAKVWYLHNVMNIITYIFYSVGFYYSGMSRQRNQR